MNSLVPVLAAVVLGGLVLAASVAWLVRRWPRWAGGPIATPACGACRRPLPSSEAECPGCGRSPRDVGVVDGSWPDPRREWAGAMVAIGAAAAVAMAACLWGVPRALPGLRTETVWVTVVGETQPGDRVRPRLALVERWDVSPVELAAARGTEPGSGPGVDVAPAEAEHWLARPRGPVAEQPATPLDPLPAPSSDPAWLGLEHWERLVTPPADAAAALLEDARTRGAARVALERPGPPGEVRFATETDMDLIPGGYVSAGRFAWSHAGVPAGTFVVSEQRRRDQLRPGAPAVLGPALAGLVALVAAAALAGVAVQLARLRPVTPA